MTLKEFIKDTLLQITSAVTEAKSEYLGIAPWVIQQPGVDAATMVSHKTDGKSAYFVEYDIAVTVAEKKDTEVKGGAAIYVVESGARRNTSTEQSTVSRVKLKVPVYFGTPV